MEESIFYQTKCQLQRKKLKHEKGNPLQKKQKTQNPVLSLDGINNAIAHLNQLRQRAERWQKKNYKE